MTEIDDIVAAAEAAIGHRYVVGTEGPATFDCSGLIWWCFDQTGHQSLIGGSRRRAAGYARWMADNSLFSNDFRDAQRGDLIFYEHPVGHVALYLGGGDAISALIPPYGVRRHKYNRISVPFYGVGLVDYGDGRTGTGDAGDTTGDESDTIHAADPSWDADAVEAPHGRAFWHVEFEDRARRAGGKGGTDVVNKITRRRPPPPPPPPDADTTEDSALTLDVWQLTKDNIDFTSHSDTFGDTDITSHSFSFAHMIGAAQVSVGSDIEGEVLWPWAGCGSLMPAHTGETRYEIWAEIDLSGGIPDDWLGLRASGDGSNWSDGPVDYGSISGATPTAHEKEYAIGWGIPDPTGPGQFIVLGLVHLFADWSVFIPRNLLTPVTSALVIAPTWIAGGYFCAQDLNDPGGSGLHRPAIDGSGGAAVALGSANGVATVVPVLLSGTGKTPWVPGDGDIDGTNATFTLIGWDGTGTPEARIDGLVAGAGDYTFDAGATTVTFTEPPPVGSSVAFRYSS